MLLSDVFFLECTEDPARRRRPHIARVITPSDPERRRSSLSALDIWIPSADPKGSGWEEAGAAGVQGWRRGGRSVPGLRRRGESGSHVVRGQCTGMTHGLSVDKESFVG